MKKIFSILCASYAFLLVHMTVFAESLSPEELREAIVPSDSYRTISSTEQGEGVLDYVLGFARDSIFALMAVIAIGVFIYIGARLIVARGNQEEFQKALKTFVYAVVGILFTAFAWAIINFVVGLDI